MRRDYFTIDIRPEPGDDGIPTVAIEYTGPPGGLRDRLTETAEATLESSELDVAFRHQADSETGVLSLTDRLTGEFIFEVAASVSEVDALVDAAQHHDGDGEYEIRLTDSDGKSLVYEKAVLLVYDEEGELLRQRSLIPGSVEL
jgi:nitrogen fixation protein FixH